MHRYKKIHFLITLSLNLLANDKYTPKHQLLNFLSHTCPELKNEARCCNATLTSDLDVNAGIILVKYQEGIKALITIRLDIPLLLFLERREGPWYYRGRPSVIDWCNHYIIVNDLLDAILLLVMPT